MITTARPSTARLESFLARQIGAKFSYPYVGCTTRPILAPGYRFDSVEVVSADDVFM